jgi:hypothetical protein
MLTKINRQVCINQYQVFPLCCYNYDKDEEELFYPRIFKSYILTLPSKSFKAHARALGVELNKLALTLSAGEFIFLGDTETPWLYQQNDFRPVKEALQYLAANKVGKRFNGALQVPTPELPEFIKQLAWLTRCNAALPDFHFTDQGKNILGNICKYGNLHLNSLNEQMDKRLQSFVESSRFSPGDKNSCYNWSGKTSAIRGRQTIT